MRTEVRPTGRPFALPAVEIEEAAGSFATKPGEKSVPLRVVTDLRERLRAARKRIEVLEAQNEALRAAFAALSEGTRRGD
jgi:hypothetical protein